MFISKSSDRCHVFFSKIRKTKEFEWIEECQKALEELKEYLTTPPLLAKPEDGEPLYLYLSVSDATISGVLVREEGMKQNSVHYISKSLLDSETRYSQLEKLTLALVISGRKLRPYFQCHPIVFWTEYPLKNVQHRSEMSSHLTKWVVELSEYDIIFQPRTSIKSQALADFVANFSPMDEMEADKEALCLENWSDQQEETSWKLAVGGSSTRKGCGLGIVLTKPMGEVIQRVVRCDFRATKNETEYEAMIVGLDLSIELEAKNIVVISDSQLVANQLSGVYQAKDSRMSIYMEAVKERPESFNTFSVS